MRRLRIFNCWALAILLVFLYFGNPVPAFAQDNKESPWSDVVDENGHLRYDTLTDLGETVEDAEWMDIPLPFGMELDLDANYHRYQTPDGDIVVLPTPLTVMMMAMHPVESGLTGAQSQLALGGFIGAEFLGALLGDHIDWERLSESNPAYAQPDHFWNAVIHGQENIWTWFAGLDFLTDLALLSWNDMDLRMGLLLYLNGAAKCQGIPGGCSGVVIEQLLPKTCPAPSVAIQQPMLSIRKTAPENPLVVGQDPEKRGADIQGSVSIPPVIYTWYEPIYKEVEVCHGVGAGEIADCRQSSASLVNDGKSGRERVLAECRPHVEYLPDPVISVQANAILNPASKAWIVNQLSSAYYEAYVHRESFNLVPGLASWSGGCSGGTCTASAWINHVPFADPGVFDLSLRVQTAGASFNGRKITQPRSLSATGQARVFVTLTTLIEQP
jgi:hypothetical protein